MQFLGIKWRFLRSDLEKESLPSLPKRPVVGSETAAQHSIAKSAVLDTYLKHLQLTGVDDLDSMDSFDYSSVVPVSLPRGVLLGPETHTETNTQTQSLSPREGEGEGGRQ